MKLKHRDPGEYLGQTVLHDGLALEVKEVTSAGIVVSSYRFGEQARTLSREEFEQSTLYPTKDSIRARYPLLIRALRWAGILSHGEAEGAILGLIAYGKDDMGSEAVARIGGSSKAVQHAWRCRHVVARDHRRHRASVNSAETALPTASTSSEEEIRVFGFGEAPSAVAIGYGQLQRLWRGTKRALQDEVRGQDVVAVIGASIHGSDDAFEFGIFTRKESEATA